MGKDAIAAGPQVRNDTKRRDAAAGFLAALWPSLLGPEHGGLWREQNRRIWTRRVSHIALIAAILGIGAVAAAPPFHSASPAETQNDVAGGPPAQPHHGVSGASPGAPGMERLAITLRTLHAGGSDTDGAPQNEPLAPPLSESVGDYGENVAQGPDTYGPRAPWDPLAPYSPTPTHALSSFGGGGGGGGPSGSSSSSSKGGTPPSSGGSDDPFTLTDPGAGGPQTPDHPDGPAYTVDPDNGPHQLGDPQWPPADWTPTGATPEVSPLSPVPEPQTWLMMLLGFGSLGAVTRFSRRTHRMPDTTAR